MQLAAIWVKEHFLFGTQIINLGGKYHYTIQEAIDETKDTIKISRQENEKYISGFYSFPNKKLSLISAIVGKNGSGKSTVIEIIRSILNKATWGRISFELGILIFEDSISGKVAIYFSDPFKQDSFLESQEVRKKKTIELLDFEKTDTNTYVESIFYSPFLDIKENTLNYGKSPDIDLSLDRLFQDDYENNRSKDSPDPFTEHKYQNIYRQFNFLKKPLIQSLRQDFDFPFYDKVELSFRGPIYSPNKDYPFHNTPYDFREPIKWLYELWRNQINSTERQVHSNTDIEEDRKIIKLWFIKELLGSLCHPLEDNNAFLDEGKMRDLEYPLPDLPLKEAVFLFLDKHFFEKFKKVSLPVKEVKDLISNTFTIIDSLEKTSLTDRSKIFLSFDDAQKIMELHKSFINKMRSFSTEPAGFLDINPNRDISSGEKAVLDLFSRFEHGISLINQKDYKGQFPNHFLVLIDEGDLGFHPVWKKRYVSNLVKVLPKLFEQYDSTVQIIFTTHDPLTLSDIPNYNVVYLDKQDNNLIVLDRDNPNRPQYSFGANISHLLSDSFFVEDGLVGTFAIEKIDKTIEWLNKPHKAGDEEYHRKLIEIIDEPLIKRKLSAMYSEKTGINYLEENVLEEQIKVLNQRLVNLKKKNP